MKKSNRLFNELMEIESHKGTVWDDRNRDLGYKAHLKGLQSVQKKVDNDSPLIASTDFFEPMKYYAQQSKIEQRINSNILILKKLNVIQRTKAKIDCYNARSEHPDTLRKFKERENEIRLTERLNKKFAKIISSTPPRVELTQDLLKRFLERDRRAIFMSAKYKIVFDFLKHPKMKRLESPEGTRVLFDVRKKDGNFFGRFEILLFDEKLEPKVIKHFTELCKTSYKDCYIHKIMKGLFVETGDVESSKVIFPSKSQKILPHNRDALVSLVLNDEDGSISTKFVITMQPMRVLDDNHLVIGRVTEGRNLITDLDAHGTHFGIPEKMFFITVVAVRK